ncbi:unnamed protein product [Bemisia tabaci]|uniref:Vacuolar protein-sorting-associated protein 25 n=1 Tax=Bemisia tabaci TaxID=7038 RepID=A0A9P0A3K4_BEMTA|nr:PREDICTED: vacuolar protein-sorting-associated protein 25 [Bemisia tabaci]CAH0383429.1 unnamed protein product [Bemisia tabaci]
MAEINWPWQYNFPPFFTIQPNKETQKLQLDAWKSLVLDYCRSTKQCVIDVREANNSPVFHNAAISRKLPPEGILLVLEELAASGNAEPLDKTKTRWFIFWRTLQELASIIHTWAKDNGFTNTVCTFYELTNTPDQEFSGIDEDVLQKALKELEKQGKAEVILSPEINGVKFF